MSVIQPGNTLTGKISAGRSLSVTVGSGGTAYVSRFRNGAMIDQTILTSGQSQTFGPYNLDVQNSVAAIGATVTVTEKEALQGLAPSLTGSFTFATLPAASSVPASTSAYTSDVGPVTSNGVIWKASGSGSAYLGQVATGSRLLQFTATANKQIMTRTPCWARDNISSVSVAFANWYSAASVAPSNGTEAVLGSGAITVTAAIEYPVGNYMRLPFSGTIQGTIPAGNTLFSDTTALPTPIPSGAQFWVRAWANNPDGTIVTPYGAGTQSNIGVTTADLTVTAGTITANDFAYTPLAIIGMTTKPSIALVGDSRVVGVGDIPSGFPYYRGYLERLLGPSFATLNLGCGGDRAMWANVNYAKRGALLQYCSHIVCNYGINDIGTALHTAAQVHTDLQTLFALSTFAGKPTWQTAIEPKSTSTDSFVTETNQTTATYNGVIITFNNTLRAGIAGIQGVIDPTQYEQSIATPGVWQAPNGIAQTSDGLHQNQVCSLRVQSLAPIAGLFTR